MYASVCQSARRVWGGKLSLDEYIIVFDLRGKDFDCTQLVEEG
jgi:hypothetical protein